jgi:hypothetical protein
MDGLRVSPTTLVVIIVSNKELTDGMIGPVMYRNIMSVRELSEL